MPNDKSLFPIIIAFFSFTLVMISCENISPPGPANPGSTNPGTGDNPDHLISRFSKVGDLEGWTLAPPPLSEVAVVDGALQIEVNSESPGILSPELEIDADRLQWLKMRLEHTTASSQVRIYWTTTESKPTFSPERSETIDLRDPSEAGVYLLNIGGHKAWRGTVTQLKITLEGANEGSVTLDYVYLKETQVWFSDLRLTRLRERAEGGERQYDRYLENELLAQWEQSREIIDILFIPPDWYVWAEQDESEAFRDELFEQFVKVVKESGMTVAINVPPGRILGSSELPRVAGRRWFKLAKRLQKAGVTVSHFALQSVLSKKNEKYPYSMDERYQYILEHVYEVASQDFPEARIGILDALPSHERNYRKHYQGLQRFLGENSYNLDFVLLDMPRNVPENPRNNVSWQAYKDIEDFVQDELGIIYGIITTSATAGQTSSQAFYQEVKEIPILLREQGVQADFYSFQWWFPYPRFDIPEAPEDSHKYTSFRTLLAFFDHLTHRSTGSD